jgi:DNA-binding MarR family transcriptional regulator
MASALTERELGAWRGFLQAHARLTRRMDATLQREHGLSLGDYDVFVLLDEAGRLRMSDLADRVLMSSGGITRLAERLERRGLIRRERCASDGRGYEASLTPAGADLLEVARVTHRAEIHALFLAQLSAAEQETLARVWKRLLA